MTTREKIKINIEKDLSKMINIIMKKKHLEDEIVEIDEKIDFLKKKYPILYETMIDTINKSIEGMSNRGGFGGVPYGGGFGGVSYGGCFVGASYGGGFGRVPTPSNSGSQNVSNNRVEPPSNDEGCGSSSGGVGIPSGLSSVKKSE